MPRLKNANHEKLARLYAKEAIETGGKVVKTKIYRKVYKEANYNSARSIASTVLAKPDIQLRISEIIAQKNSPEDLSADLANLRQANKQVFDPEGNLVEIRDNQTRISAVQTAIKVIGGLNEPHTENKTINFNLMTQGNGSSSNGILDSLLNAVNKLSGLNDKLGIINNQ